MNFSQLQSFIALAETGSFTEAAYAINLTQSAVSHALATLENESGVTLFERNRKGIVALTHAGQKIIPHVRVLLAQVEAIEQEAKAAQGLAMGKLRLGSILSIISPDLLASLLTRFQASYPGIEVVLFEGAMQEVGEWIEQSVIDIGFVVLPAPDIESTLLTTDEMCVLISSQHPLHAQTAITPAELHDEGFIMEKNPCMMQLMKRAGFEQNKIKSHIRFQASDSATIHAMVREGLGVTLVPRMMLPRKLDGVVALSLRPRQPLQIGLAVKSHDVASRNATLFIQTALACMQERTPQLALPSLSQ